MRIVYADPGLRNNQGHHANSCRTICRELRRRGVKVMVLSCLDIGAELKEELDATPLFRVYTYYATDGDPVCGALNAFDTSSRLTAEDLGRVTGLKAEDVLYLNSAQPAQFMALIRWWKGLPEEDRLRVVVEFGTDPGVDVLEMDDSGKLSFRLHDYRYDPRAMFHRFAAHHLSTTDLARFHLVTFDETSSRVFSAVINRPVGVLPLPQGWHFPITSRVGRRPITVSVLGHQRPDKGYHLIPEVARRLLAHEANIRLFIHNSVPEGMPQIQTELHAIAAVEPRLIVDEQAAGAENWSALLRRSDLILCPYEPARYIASYSAVATDAIANAIPLVVPAGTSMARLVSKFGGPGTTFKVQEAGEIVAATRRAIADFDVLATRAIGAASQWTATMGGAHTVNGLLSLVSTA